MLRSAGSTGRIEVHVHSTRGQIFLRAGEPYFAQSSRCRSLIGQKLLQAGAITEPQLQEAHDRQVETKERLGRALMSLGLVTPEQVKDAVVDQIKEALADLLEWDQGEFTWEPGIEIELELQVPHLAPRHGAPSNSLEGTDASNPPPVEPLREPAPFVAPPDDAIVVLSPLSPDTVDFFDITNEQWRVARFANGRSDIAQIASDVGPTQEEARRLIHDMLAEGILAVLDASEFGEYRHVWDRRSDDAAPGVSEEPEVTPDHAFHGAETIDGGSAGEGFEDDAADSGGIVAATPPPPPSRVPSHLESHRHVKLDRSMLARELSGLFKSGRQSISG
jgi:hypothetical protein